MITAAFSSKAMYVPSSRPNPFFVRTTTALTTSPFLTVPCGSACLTVATIVHSRESSVAESTLQTLSSRMAQAAQTPTILDGGAGRAAAAGRIAIGKGSKCGCGE